MRVLPVVVRPTQHLDVVHIKLATGPARARHDLVHVERPPAPHLGHPVARHAAPVTLEGQAAHLGSSVKGRASACAHRGQPRAPEPGRAAQRAASLHGARHASRGGSHTEDSTTCPVASTSMRNARSRPHAYRAVTSTRIIRIRSRA